MTTGMLPLSSDTFGEFHSYLPHDLGLISRKLYQELLLPISWLFFSLPPNERSKTRIKSGLP